jgi:hypothetical protein
METPQREGGVGVINIVEPNPPAEAASWCGSSVFSSCLIPCFSLFQAKHKTQLPEETLEELENPYDA